MTPDDLADVVVRTVKTATAPLLERLARVEQENAHLNAALATVTELRDRVVMVETKAALVVPAPVAEPVDPVDLTPVLERIARLDAEQAALTATVAQWPALRDRVAAVETKELPASLTATDVELSTRKALEPVQALLADARERLIAAETRAPIPGPSGRDGVDGAKGLDGAAGRDGLGFDDMAVDFDGDRTLTLTFSRGAERKTWPITLPYLRYQGVFVEGKGYTPGDVTTWGGSTWHANKETTAKPGDGSKDWTLIVKKGRDGQDGKDAPGALPVVAVGRR